jgi:hypothetical protein
MRSAERIAEYPIREREHCPISLVDLLKQTYGKCSIYIQQQSIESPLAVVIDPLTTTDIFTDGAGIKYDKSKSGVPRIASPLSEPGKKDATYIAAIVLGEIGMVQGNETATRKLKIITNSTFSEVEKSFTQVTQALSSS